MNKEDNDLDYRESDSVSCKTSMVYPVSKDNMKVDNVMRI